jgi:hypothetical protein
MLPTLVHVQLSPIGPPPVSDSRGTPRIARVSDSDSESRSPMQFRVARGSRGGGGGGGRGGGAEMAHDITQRA